jgi:hypothetical protein
MVIVEPHRHSDCYQLLTRTIWHYIHADLDPYTGLHYIVISMHFMHIIRFTIPFTVTGFVIGEIYLPQPTRSRVYLYVLLKL